MSHTTSLVGLDFHAQTKLACAIDTLTGEINRTKMSSEPEVVCFWIQQLPARTKVVYEAGPTGYPLCC